MPLGITFLFIWMAMKNATVFRERGMSHTATRATVLAPPRDRVEPVYSDAETTIPVFFGCDDNFLPHALTAIASMMANASPANNYDIFIVQSGIPRERMDIAAGWMERYPNATLRFIDIDAALDEIRDDLVITERFGIATYFRIFAPRVFARYKRIAYLDSDVVVLGDAADFYRLDLDGMQMGAVRDHVSIGRSLKDPAEVEFWKTQLNMQPGDDYFGAANLVMDLELMRREDTVQKCLEKIRGIAGVRYPDQDAMNAVLRGKVKMLPCEWNYADWMDDEEGEFILLPEAFRREIRAAGKHVRIRHFAGEKPWTRKYEGRSADKYWMYAAETPFYRQLLEQFRRDCASVGLLRRLVNRMQEGNFTLRMRLAPEEKKAKYAGRLGVLRSRRTTRARQKKLAETLLKADKGA